MQLATLAGGCFWCLEAVFNDLEGVESVRSGYMGGAKADPTYEEVCTGNTGHAEVVQVAFDPSVVSYEDLLGVFFATHDPTTPDRQGNDVGTQYRSAIFHHSPAQKAAAEAVIANLQREKVFGKPIVTQVAEAAAFYPAEAYHQRYFERVGAANPYCTYVIEPKVSKFRKRYVDRLKRSSKEAQ